MCGIVGMVGQRPVNEELYESLGLLQHRGQDAAGIATSAGGHLYMRKALGLVRDVFRAEHMTRLKGNMGLGHVRYPTAGTAGSSSEAQPFYVNSPYGISLAHNGNLTNAHELLTELTQKNLRHINTSSDSEILLNVIAHELQALSSSTTLNSDTLFLALKAVFQRLRGGFAVIGMIVGHGVFAFRDPNGIRPAVIGRRVTDLGEEYIVASESLVLEALEFELMRDLRPGEAVYIESDGTLHSHQCCEPAEFTPCLFEYVYFARPDSIIDRVSVYQSRMRMGDYLAQKVARELDLNDIDVVIPIPESSRTSALELSMALGIPYREGFIKNRYVGRTFIMPGQKARKKSVRQKLNPMELEFAGKSVLLVDDSIVRGTTSEQIVQMARNAGAKKVYMASAAPPVKYPNVYGIDMPAASELIASKRSVDEVCRMIGADGLVYQDLEDLISAVRDCDELQNERYEGSCFNGQYVTGDVDHHYLLLLEARRNDKAVNKSDNSHVLIDVGGL